MKNPTHILFAVPAPSAGPMNPQQRRALAAGGR
jgi:hypothetical protein